MYFNLHITLGIDICTSDPDNETNCDNLSDKARFDPDTGVINQGESLELIFALDDGIGPVTITNMTVTTPLGEICIYDTLPITVPVGGEQLFIYPDDFDNCNTDQRGVYTATLDTDIGVLVTIFNTSFYVLPESIIGAVGVVGSIAAAFILYARKYRV